MKLRICFLGLFISIMLLVLSCSKEEQANLEEETPQQVFPYLTGKIEPFDKEIDDMRIGLFLKSADPNDSEYYLSANYRKLVGNDMEWTKYPSIRLGYGRKNDKSKISLSPMDLGAMINAEDSTFFINLPISERIFDIYYPVIWIDENRNNKIDLADYNYLPFGVSLQDTVWVNNNEFSRFPMYANTIAGIEFGKPLPIDQFSLNENGEYYFRCDYKFDGFGAYDQFILLDNTSDTTTFDRFRFIMKSESNGF
jgi:hypothetical protein